MEIRDRNDFSFTGDIGGPPTAPQVRATSREPGGQYVLIGNPVSWMIHNGQAQPFISLRGGRDAGSQSVRDALAAGAVPNDVPMAADVDFFGADPPGALDPVGDSWFPGEIPDGMRKPGLERTLFGGQAPLVDTTPGGWRIPKKDPPANVKPTMWHKMRIWWATRGKR